ncbi:repetitive organellar protein-like [Clarias gariepinus]|uniref:repetitive organellar protein-like n=1 Tax=Clarias gariepinus TaxID=13013 RepID=UPI00234CBA91|nr:repetitive organellar protein-like [Clarias gariepinus]
MSKKTGGKKTKGKGKEGKKDPGETFLLFQIEVKMKEIEEFKKEIKELEAMNQQLNALRHQLLEEQQENLNMLHKQAKEQEKNLKKKKVTNKEDEEQAVQSNLKLARMQEEEVAELGSRLSRVQAEVEELQGQVQALHLYKDVGSAVHQEQIQKLQSELKYMQKSFQVMSENSKSSLKEAIDKIDNAEEEKQLARQRAIEKLNKPTKPESNKNKWLKKEIAAYQEEISLLEAAVRNLRLKTRGDYYLFHQE